MTDFLEQVVAERRADVERARGRVPNIVVGTRESPRRGALAEAQRRTARGHR